MKHVAIIPLGDIERIQLYINDQRKGLSFIVEETGADYAINAGYFTVNGYGRLQSSGHVKADGMVANNPGWKDVAGYAWDKGPDIRHTILPTSAKSYLSCTDLTPERLKYNADVGGKRARSAIGISGKNILLYCTDERSGSTPENLKAELWERYGCQSALMLDGGGSCQCNFQGSTITSGRVVANVILVFLKKGEKKMKVVLDPGHGSASDNHSPDGVYSEAGFALAMAKRMKAILERHGVEVVLTRSTEANPTGKGDNNDLAARVTVSNKARPDLFVSLHSDATAGNTWTGAKGWSIYTSAAGDTAQRNIAARAILEAVKGAGIETRTYPLQHSAFAVLKNTAAPAVLIEHGFHTNRDDVQNLLLADYRDKLAEAECKGILAYLGVQYVQPKTEDTPNDWAAVAWKKAKAKGIFDGTKPQGNMTREMLAVVLDRLGLLEV